MGFLQKIFGRKKQTEAQKSKELIALSDLEQFMSSLLNGDHYVAKSEYLNILKEKKGLVEWFAVLKSSGTMDDYCKKNSVNADQVSQILERYEKFEVLIDMQNDQYVETQMRVQEKYLDSILKECDPKIRLDADQRKVVLTDEDYCLVVAGAGAGKTTTVAAKVKYLVEKQKVDPKQILIISFTNKAVNELKQRIIGDLHIECPIATFHSTGNAVLHKNDPDKLSIVDASKLYFVVQDYFRDTVLRNESAVNNLILFFASYFDAPYEGKDLNEDTNFGKLKRIPYRPLQNYIKPSNFTRFFE